MTISIEIESGFYELDLALSSFSASYRHATFSTVVAVVVGFSILRLDPPRCEEIAKTTWGFRFGRNYRVIALSYSLLFASRLCVGRT